MNFVHGCSESVVTSEVSLSVLEVVQKNKIVRNFAVVRLTVACFWWQAKRILRNDGLAFDEMCQRKKLVRISFRSVGLIDQTCT